MIRIRVISTVRPAEYSARAKRAGKVLVQQVLKDTDQFVPARTGTLAGGARAEDDRIVYPGPYARFLWEGLVMVDPDTGSPWARRGVSKVTTGKNLVFSRAMHGQAQDHWMDASKERNLERWKKIYAEAMTDG